jgi:Flp pilus assembly protein TadG
MPRDRDHRTGDGGGGLIELALLLPLLATCVLGVVDLGRMWQLKNRLTNAAREGVAVAQYSPGSVDPNCHGHVNVTDAVVGEDAESPFPATPVVIVTVTHGGVRRPYTGCTDAVVVAGDEVEVRATVRVQYLAPGLAALLGSDVGVSGFAHAAVVR